MHKLIREYPRKAMVIRNALISSMLIWLAYLHLTTFAFRGSSYTRHSQQLSAISMSTSMITNPNYELSLRSPCKINLFLRITGKRENGYHDLASLFQTISLSDYMHFSLLPPGSIRDELVCSDTSLQIDDSNLVIKALNLMRKKSPVKDAYFKVRLDKKVPMQAGLGCGSGKTFF